MNFSLPGRGAGSRVRGGGVRHATEGSPGVLCALSPSSCRVGLLWRGGCAPCAPGLLWRVSCRVGHLSPCDCPRGFCCRRQRDKAGTLPSFSEPVTHLPEELCTVMCV